MNKEEAVTILKRDFSQFLEKDDITLFELTGFPSDEILSIVKEKSNKDLYEFLLENRERIKFLLGDEGEEIEPGEAKNMTKVYYGGNSVSSVAYSPSGDNLVVGYFNGQIKIIDTKTGYDVMVLKGHNSSVLSVCVELNSNYLATADLDGIIKIWELKSGNEIAEFIDNDNNSQYFIFSIAFSPDGKYISSGRGKKVKLWEIQKNKKAKQFDEPEFPVISLAYSHNGQFIACGDDDGKIRVWDTTNGDLLFTADTKRQIHVSSVNFSPDDKYLVSGEWNGSIKIWDAINGNKKMN